MLSLLPKLFEIVCGLSDHTLKKRLLALAKGVFTAPD